MFHLARCCLNAQSCTNVKCSQSVRSVRPVNSQSSLQLRKSQHFTVSFPSAKVIILTQCLKSITILGGVLWSLSMTTSPRLVVSPAVRSLKRAKSSKHVSGAFFSLFNFASCDNCGGSALEANSFPRTNETLRY